MLIKWENPNYQCGQECYGFFLWSSNEHENTFEILAPLQYFSAFCRRSQDRSSVQEREQQQLQQLESKKREAEKLEQLRLKAMQQTESTQEKINLKYTSSTAVRPGQTFGYGQVTTGQVSSRKYEILARASSVGRFEDREGLNPEMMMRAQSQSTSARGSPAPIGN